jgi:hypothetical protein
MSEMVILVSYSINCSEFPDEILVKAKDTTINARLRGVVDANLATSLGIT